MTDAATTPQASSVGHRPAGERWAFDEGVTAVFDDMLQRSIPQLDVMRSAVLGLASRHVKDGTSIVDLGCSRGDAMAALVDRFGARNRFVGVEVSGPMLEAARSRFQGYINTGIIDIRALDLRTTYPHERASVTLAVLCLQFIPINYRQRVLRNAFRSTLPGGALLVVEKVLGAGADIDDAFIELYHRRKLEGGYSEDDVRRKAMALEGVLVPLTAHANEELLRGAGFTDVDCFWRWMNFSGWVALRGA